MSAHIKAKVTARVDYDSTSRPSSPLKSYTPSASPTPMIRPKAKINSSATIAPRKSVLSPGANNLAPTSRANVTHTRAPILRAPSPSKPQQVRATLSASAVSQAKGKSGPVARANVSINGSSAGLPELRQRALTATTADLSSDRHARRGSASSYVSASPMLAPILTAQSPPKLGSAASEDGGSVVSGSSAGQVRVRSKVTRLSERVPPIPQSLPSSPSFMMHPRPARVPSISNLSPSPPLAHIQTVRSRASSPVAPSINSPRYPSRESHAAKIPPFRPFTPYDDASPHLAGHASPYAEVDPLHVPLPPQSPPSSTLSFSSRSSASASRSSVSCDTRTSEASGSTAPTVNSRVNGIVRHARSQSSVDGLRIQLSPLSISREPSSSDAYGSDDDDDHDDHGLHEDPERKKRNEDKSNRKIADLEITNRSLLAINSSLEAMKHRQAKEIRDLRRRLRESILVLPPPAYRAAKSSLTQEGALAEGDDDKLGEGEGEDEENEEEEKALLEGRTDETYRRVVTLLEALLESGRRALETKPEDFMETKSGGAKVLTAEEVRTWRRQGDDAETPLFVEGEDASYLAAGRDDEHRSTRSRSRSRSRSRPTTPALVALPPDHDEISIGSEDEVEASHGDDGSDYEEPDDDGSCDQHHRRPTVPPITVTPSPSP